MTARYLYYLLADSTEGIRKQAELDQAVPTDGPVDSDIRKGFVYKTVPHVTLGSIANNPDIAEGLSRTEIDAAIARHADKEVLYDQPYEDSKRLRVTGPSPSRACPLIAPSTPRTSGALSLRSPPSPKPMGVATR